MKFDPARNFSTVYGNDPTMPGAKFQQGPFIYTIHHVCINPDIDAPVQSPVALATEAMVKDLTEKLVIATKELQVAQAGFENFDTPGNKSKLTKATNKYNGIKSELDGLMVG
jgi:hypothetical protein